MLTKSGTGMATMVGSYPRTLYRSSRDLGQWLVDRLLNVRTSDRSAHSLDLGPDEVKLYRATGWFAIARTLRQLRPGPDDVFLDLGSGLGRTVLVARRMAFQRVIGIEFSPEMHAVAESNLRHERFAGRSPTTLVLGDILQYEIPADVSIIYLYNTLNDEAFAHLAARLVASVDAHARPLRIAYLNPREEEQLLATGRVRRVGEVRGSLRPSGPWARSLTTCFYDVLPAVPSKALLEVQPAAT